MSVDCTCKEDRIGLSAFAPMVLERCPNAPAGQIETHVRDACIELCTKSGWLEREAVVQHIDCGIRDWPLITDPDEVVVRVTQVLIDDVPLGKARSDYAGRGAHCGHESGHWSRHGVYWVEALASPDASVHIDWHMGGHCEKLTIRYQVAPSEEACFVDKRLFTEARRAIAYGALSSLTDDNSLLFERRFKEAVSSLRARRLAGRNGTHGQFNEIHLGV